LELNHNNNEDRAVNPVDALEPPSGGEEVMISIMEIPDLRGRRGKTLSHALRDKREICDFLLFPFSFRNTIVTLPSDLSLKDINNKTSYPVRGQQRIRICCGGRSSSGGSVSLLINKRESE
jgi:hypothetical protein